MMHTQFVLKGSGKSCVLFNSVESGYLASFGSKPFDAIGVTVNYGENSNFIKLPVTYCGAKYLGEGSAALTFTALLDSASGSVVESICFLSDIGQAVNMADGQSFVLDGKTEITATVYVKILGDVSLSLHPESLFEWLFGVRECALGCEVVGGSGGENILVTVQKTEQTVSISVEINEDVVGEKLAITCDKGAVLYFDAPSVTAGEEKAVAISGVVQDVEDGLEITHIAGSAVTSSEIASISLGRSLGKSTPFPSLFLGVGRVESSLDGKSLAVFSENGVTLYSQDGEGFKCVNPFAPYFSQKADDCFFAGDSLYILSGKSVERVDRFTGQSIEYAALSSEASRIFVTECGYVIVAGESGITVYNALQNLATEFSYGVYGGKFDFDELTQTLTVLHPGGVRQYRFNGTEHSYVETLCSTEASSCTGIDGRWGWVIACFDNGYTVFDLLLGTTTFYPVQDALSVSAFEGGNRIAIRLDGYTLIKDISPQGTAEIGRINGISSVHVCPIGVLAGQKFYPFLKRQNRFLLPSAESGATFTVYKETAYFPQETHIFTFEAVL